MAGSRRKCLVEVEKPGLLVVMEDVLDQVCFLFVCLIDGGVGDC